MKVAAPNDAITVLVVNCGSSTIKYQLFRMPDHQVLSKGLIDRIGENASTVRASVCRNLDAFGIVIDSVSNRRVVSRREGRISAPESQIDVLVVPTDEEAAIAADTYQIVMEMKDTTP